jgi:protein-disulfide isomerase
MPLDLAHMDLEERTKYLELKERYKKKLRPWYKKWWGISLLSILALILVIGTIGGLYIFNLSKQIKAENAYNQTITANETMRLAINGVGTNYFMGNEGAPLTIIEFSDFACPYCQQAHKIIRDAVAKYPGKIKAVYRDMPLHDNSLDLALAARCTGEQGKFWEMHDLLFENQSSLTATGDELTPTLNSLAGTLGIDMDKYNTCYTSKKYLSDIGTDYGDGAALSLVGTPTWFLNEKRLSGYLPEEDFFAIIDSMLINAK